jgi:hypothetical protein
MEEQTKKQKQKEIMRLMEAWLEDGSNSHQTALGFIRADIKERGFEGWLNMDAEMVAFSFYDTTEEMSNELMNDLATMLDQENMLDDIGVEQTMRIDQHDLLIGFRKGMLDIFKSLVIYFDAKQQAEHQYEDCRG